MTKNIRIENANLSNHKVRVWLEDLIDGVWVRNEPSRELSHPTQLIDHCIHSTRRLVIEEVKD